MSYPATLEELRGILSSTLGTSESGDYDHWPTTRKNSLINQAQRAVENEIHQVFENYYFTTMADGLVPVDNTIDLSALLPKFKRLVQLLKKNSAGNYDPVIVLDAHESWKAKFATADVWFNVGDKLRMDSTSTTTSTYRLIYNFKLDNLVNDGDVCQIPAEYQEAVVWRAAHVAAIQEKAPDAGRYEAEYEKLISRMRSQAMHVIKVLNRRVRQVDEGGDGFSTNDAFFRFISGPFVS